MTSGQDPVWGTPSRWSTGCGGRGLAASSGAVGDGRGGPKDLFGPWGAAPSQGSFSTSGWGTTSPDMGAAPRQRSPPYDRDLSPAELSAAAAAAVEQPAAAKQQGQGDMIRQAQREAERRRGRGTNSNSGTCAEVLGAQRQAASEKRRQHALEEQVRRAQLNVAVTAVQAQAARERQREQGIDEQIRSAQLSKAAATSAQASGSGGNSAGFSDAGWGFGGLWPGDEPELPGEGKGLVVSPEILLGNWCDAQGNSVLVYSTDAWELRLAAAMSRPNRPDLQLSVRPSPDGGWFCGNFELDPSISTPEKLTWYSPEGRTSVWLRGRM